MRRSILVVNLWWLILSRLVLPMHFDQTVGEAGIPL